VWSTEVTLGRTANDEFLLGVRLIVNSNETEIAIDPSVPGLVQQIADQCGILDGDFPVISTPHVVQNEEQAAQFVDWLSSRSRKLPAVVASGDERSDNPDTPLIDTELLARRMCGLAHVVVLPAKLTYALSDEVGKSLSVFHGGVRIYNPGFDLLADAFDHRLYHPQSVSDDPAAVVADIRKAIARDSLRRTRLGRDVIPFASIRSESLRQEQEALRTGNVSDSEQLDAADRRIAAIEAENENLKGQADQLFQLSEEEAARAEASEKQLYASWARIENLEHALREAGNEIDATTDEPQDWDQFTAWCDSNFSGRLSLAPAARRGVKKAAFTDLPTVAFCIRWLATTARDRFIEGGGLLANIAIGDGLTNAPCGSDEYSFEFQTRRLAAKWHVKNGGNTRQPERCLRIYYAFDDLTRQIVVSDMPAHRTTGAS